MNQEKLTLKEIRFPEDLYVEPMPPTAIKSSVLLLKRILDLVGTLIGLVLFSPIMMIISVAIKLTSKGSVFYKQERIGQNGKKFKMIKFRSMKMDAEKDGAVWAREDKGQVDIRVTSIGNFLRKSHLDETPQLFLVLSGTMSLVGPRPERSEFAKPLSLDFAYYKERVVNLKPGITGISQMNREMADDVSTDEKLMGDHAYGIFLCNGSIFNVWLLDTKILVKTVLNIIFKKKNTHGKSG
jgi:lipopolysaccharide/colanic/teichoic acid biosynthesis glycosyltransferase